jgi:hypothetical protein
MICPECGGRGFRQRRLLWIFRWRLRCRQCDGSGEYPPPRRLAVRSRSLTRWADDDRERWPTIATGGSTDLPPRAGDDTFEVGSGGRSGGGGGSASWRDTATNEPPVIVDPFAGDSTSMAAADSVDAADIAIDASSSDDSSSDTSGSAGDSGTSY